MTYPEEESIVLENLRNLASTYESSPTKAIYPLKLIKHALIGHPQTKQLYADHGIIPPLISLLKEECIPEDLRVEAGICIGSLAYGGEHFASLLLDAGLLPPLISSLNPLASTHRLIRPSLRTLNTLFDTCSSDLSSKSQSIIATISSELYSNSKALVYIHHILSQTSPSPLVQQQISLAASLVAKTCDCAGYGGTGDRLITRERRQHQLVDYGVLEALGRRLGGFIVLTRQRPADPKLAGGFKASLSSVRRAGKAASDDAEENKENVLPPMAPQTAKLSPILDAISVIIRDSHKRSLELLHAPWIVNSLPPVAPFKSSTFRSKSAASTPQPWGRTPSVTSPSISSTAFPPLSAAATYASDIDSPGGTPYPSGDFSDVEEQSMQISSHINQVGENDVEPSPLIPWLVSQARGGKALSRLMAISVLTNLFRVGLIGEKNVSELVLLVVPVLVRLLDDENVVANTHADGTAGAFVGDVGVLQKEEWTIRERAPAVLADLIMDNEQMQKAAVEAGAVKKLAAMLKRTFEVAHSTSAGKEANLMLRIKTSERQPTASNQAKDIPSGDEDTSSSYKIHRMRVRESTLRCLSGLTSSRDDYKKMVIETGVLPYIVASLKPCRLSSGEKPLGTTSDSKENGDSSSLLPNIVKESNPTRVLTAAAHAIRSLSRSVSIQRTSLADANLANPIWEVLHEDDMEVKIAATMVVCNLVLEFSPSRQAFIDMGVRRTLCEYAHSPNPDLRFNALWALKHLVYTAPNDYKVACLSELELGYLVDLLTADDEDYVSHGNREDEDTGMTDDEDGHGPEEEQLRMEDSIGQLSQLGNAGRRRSEYQAADEEPLAIFNRQIFEFPEKTAAYIANLEDTSTRNARRVREMLVDTQEQCLDLIRNLISGTDAGKMVDLLMTGVGEDRVYRIVHDKLRPRMLAPRIEFMTSSTASSSATVPLSSVRKPVNNLILPAIYILVHIAATQTRHQQHLMQQTELLKSLVPLFDHQNPKIRVGLAWLVINLTWKGDGSDEQACRSRVIELKRLGIVSKLEVFLVDTERDVKERAKTAMHQIRSVLDT